MDCWTDVFSLSAPLFFLLLLLLLFWMDGVDGMGWDRWRGYPRDGDLCRAERLALAVILVLELDAQNLRRRVGDWKVKLLVPGGIQVVFLGR